MTDRARGPLGGLKVLDLTRLLPGPVATMHLADLGAEVIKIEDAGAGDYARQMGPGSGSETDSAFFRIINRNKRSLRLDLKQAAGVEVFLRLARDADIVVESFRPGVVDKLGIGYDSVRASNPRIVYAAITGYGQTGPWADKAGHDLNYIAVTGVLDQIGCRGAAPAIPNLQIGDLLGGALTPLLGILAAVIGAKNGGVGSYVDVAMSDAVLAHSIFPLASLVGSGSTAARGEDLLTGGVPCYGLYRTRDERYLAVGALEPKFWQQACAVFGCPELAPLGLAMGAEGARVREALAARVAEHTLAHWSAVFESHDCCVTPVLTPREAINHPQTVARAMVVELGGALQYAPPLKLSAWPWRAAEANAAPNVGAEGTAILRGAGYGDAEIARLKAANVI